MPTIYSAKTKGNPTKYNAIAKNGRLVPLPVALFNQYAPERGEYLNANILNMIDGIKTGNINISIQKELDWTISVNEKTGEVKTIKTAECQGLLFIDKGNRVYLKGSLHKYFNNGQHNYNDFAFNDLANTIDQLKTRFGIDPNTTLLENVEFGVNIELPFTPDRVINSLVLHKGEPFNKFTKGRGVECNHAQYFIKVYNKGQQFNLKKNLLRVEVKVIKMQYFQGQKIAIKTIGDLLNTETLQALGELLTRTVNEILFTDTRLISSPNLTDPERLTIANGSNPNYWNGLKPNSEQFKQGNKDPEYKRQRKNFYKELDRFEKLLNKYKSELKTDIVSKVGDKFTNLLNKNGRIGHHKRGDKFTDLNGAKGTNLPLVYSVSLSHPLETDSTNIKICPVTGLDISMQNVKSRFLSLRGLKWYSENETVIFQQLEKRLTQRWKNATFATQLKEIAHSIRNEYFNPKNNYTRDTTKRGAKLFDDTPYYSENLKKSIYGKVC